VVILRANGPTALPRDSEIYTYRTWLTSRGPDAAAAMPHRQIGGVWAPILLVQGTADEMVAPEEAERLAAVARQAGNHDVEVAWVEGADHSFAGAEQTAVDAVVRWLAPRA
jgi:fermentation-respiration switch protein FrsA (DUF1100 family)